MLHAVLCSRQALQRVHASCAYIPAVVWHGILFAHNTLPLETSMLTQTASRSLTNVDFAIVRTARGMIGLPVIKLDGMVAQGAQLLVVLVIADADDGHLAAVDGLDQF